MGLDTSGLTHDAQTAQIATQDRDRAFHLISRQSGVGWPFYALLGLPLTFAVTSAIYSAKWALTHRNRP